MDLVTSPFHIGEIAAQRRAFGDRAPRSAPIRDFLPDQHRSFFALLRYVFIATREPGGRLLATMLEGPPGFVSSPDPRTLRIDARLDRKDPAQAAFLAGTPCGLLGIDLATRRRNRVNGMIVAAGSDGLTIAVEQSFGNCPQYIQEREVAAEIASVDGPGEVELLEGLDADARRQVESADTFFVATSAADTMQGGVDVSHRGGRPGFVRAEGDRLTIPDFRGNRYFNTLGNLVVNPQATLLFVDLEKGDFLSLSGTTEILWEGEDVGAPEGAERLWRLNVRGGWRRRNATHLRFAFRGYAPTTIATGTWTKRT